MTVSSLGELAELTAVACAHPDNAHQVGEAFDVPHFHDAGELLKSGLCDAVIIATPHYWHPPLAIRAARAGLHALCEKPLAVTAGQAKLMVEEFDRAGLSLGCMLQQRTRGIVRRAKELIETGELGKLFRVEMLCSGWIRTQAYYDSSDWRGTWCGEGGGVLMNQAPHSLDLFQWLGGMPRRLFAMLATRFHRIEVENTAEIVCQYDEDTTGHVYVSTSHAPGWEHIRLSGEKGTLLIAGDTLRLARLAMPLEQHILTCPAAGSEEGSLDVTWEDIPYPSGDESMEALHANVIDAFARHLLDGSPMVASGRDALNQTSLTSAIYLSGFRGEPVDLPVADEDVEDLLDRLASDAADGATDLRTQAGDDLGTLLKEQARP